MRPPGEPSSSGFDTDGPPSFFVRNSGTDSELVDAGAGGAHQQADADVDAIGGLSSTVIATVRSGSSMCTIGSQTTPPGSVVRSAPPIASSTKAISASRCASLASIVFSDASGSPNQSGFGSPSASKMPSALARLPRTPRSSAARS